MKKFDKIKGCWNRGDNMRRKFLLLTGFVMAAVLVTNLAFPEHEDVRRQRFLSHMVYQGLKGWHYSGQKIDDSMSEKAFWNYLRFLDYNKRYFLKPDVDALKKYIHKIDDHLEDGKVGLMTDATTTLKKRMTEARAFIPKLLDQPFDFSKEESVELESEKREFCTSPEQLREYWRKILKYQTLSRYINYKEIEKDKKDKSKIQSDGELEEKARKAVLKSYKDLYNRLEQDTFNDHLSRYLNSILQVFDPHSTYFAPKAKSDFDIDMTGQLEGIGAMLRQEDGYVKVVSIVPGGPSWRQKQLDAGDAIIKVGQGDEESVDIVGMRVDDAVKLIRGKKGSLVRLTVKKPDGRIEQIPIVRDVVVIEETYAKSALLKNDNGETYGYISLPKFYNDYIRENGRNSTTDVKIELDKLKTKGVKGVILDLRNNSGGALQDAVRMSGLFIEDGPVVQVRNRDGEIEVLKDPDKSITYKGPLVILLNVLSASASEILAAALQDYGRAIIVGGAHSFGKGTVQVYLDLDRYSSNTKADALPMGALKLTIQKFYRINGESNQFKGVVPDVVLPDRYDYFDIGEKFLEHPLKWDTITSASFQKWTKQDQLKQDLVAQSRRRILENEFFQQNAAYLEQIKARNDNTLQTLNYDKMVAEQKKLKEELDKLEQLDTKAKGYQVVSLEDIAARKKSKDRLTREKAEREQGWLEDLGKDLVLSEAVKVVADAAKK